MSMIASAKPELGTRVDRIDVVVQNVASFRIDPAVLARPDRETALIVSPVNRERLRARGRDDVFDRITVTEDFSDRGIAEAVVQLMSRGGFTPEATRLLCHDEYSLGVVAQVREKLGIPGDRPEELKAFTDKLAMKNALAGRGVRLPRHLAWDRDAYLSEPAAYAEHVAAIVGLPAFVKPVNESGSVGAARIETIEELHTWARRADERYDFEIDEYLTGTLYHVDSAVQDGELVHVRVNQYMHPCADYVAGRICSTFTVPEDDPWCGRLEAFNRQVLNGLTDKPRNGVFHHEVFRLPDGELVFLEIAARAPAALAPATGRIRWGLDIEEAHFRLQRGETVEDPAYRGPHAAFVYFPKRAGRVTALHLLELSSAHRWVWNVQVGDELEDPTDIRDFAASVLLWNSDFAALQHDLQQLDRHAALTTVR
jgi:biotin carboxylase